MAKNLVISRGTLQKKAQGQPGEGPSFEQQFGILANAQITDKYPALSPYKVLFQLEQKSDDNLFAVGAAVYKLGSNFIYIPAVFKKGKIWTGVMQYVPAMQRFLPLSDAWLSYVKNHNIQPAGDTIPADQSQDIATDASTARAKEVTDPFMKTASQTTIFDVALKMGKKASQLVLDRLNNIDYLNGALAFYSPQQLATFAKKASANFQQIKPYIITVLDKKASSLTDQEKAELFQDGFIIKTANTRVSDGPAKQHVTVIKVNNPRTSFIKPDKSCKCKALTMDGQLQDVVLLKSTNTYKPFTQTAIYGTPLRHTFGQSHDVPAKCAIKQSGITFNIITQDGYSTCAPNIMILADSVQDLDISSIGQPIESLKQIPYDTLLVTPQGFCMRVHDRYQSDKKGQFYSYNSVIRLSEQDDLIKPLQSGNSIQLPKGSRAILPSKRYRKDGTMKQDDATFCNCGPKSQFAVQGVAIDSVIRKFIQKNYDKVKVYSDSQQFTITGSKDEGTTRLQVKQAALKLVQNYNIEPSDAKLMLKEVINKCASTNQPSIQSFYISKTAAIPGDAPGWQQANIGMTVNQQDQPQVSKTDLNNYAQNDAKTMQTIQTAVNSGIKEVFDMQVLKLLIQTADPRQQISQAIPDFLNCLDKLCRILLLYHCHTDDMEQQYGAVKMQALAKSLQNTLKDLSELTVFLKLRGLGNDTNNNPDVGDLQTGTYL